MLIISGCDQTIYDKAKTKQAAIFAKIHFQFSISRIYIVIPFHDFYGKKNEFNK